jgi:hypothetical protein
MIAHPDSEMAMVIVVECSAANVWYFGQDSSTHSQPFFHLTMFGAVSSWVDSPAGHGLDVALCAARSFSHSDQYVLCVSSISQTFTPRCGG